MPTTLDRRNKPLNTGRPGGTYKPLPIKQMTEATEKKSIAELMDGNRRGMLNLVLEQLLAPRSPWRYMDPMASVWWQYDHLTLQDFKEDCEWDERWFVEFQYGVSVCNPYKQEDVSSEEEAKRLASGGLPPFEELENEQWWYDHFLDNPPERNFRDSAVVRVGIYNLRLKESEYGQK
tara:strand:+ start:177 stop:707 length:531 start_codon:yes stop_codon:yes gene_type:complete